jgi:hypothetical protein
MTDKLALRLGVNADRNASLIEQNNPYGTTPTFYEQEKSSTTIGLNLGLEKHFKGTRRLSPFIGADLSISNKTSQQETKENQVTTKIKGAWSSITTVPVFNPFTGTTSYQQVSQPEEFAFFRYGVNLVSGFDFYVSRNFFFGYEFSFGISKTQYKDVEYTRTGGTSTNYNNLDDDRSTFEFGSKLFNGIRLGYAF